MKLQIYRKGLELKFVNLVILGRDQLLLKVVVLFVLLYSFVDFCLVLNKEEFYEDFKKKLFKFDIYMYVYNLFMIEYCIKGKV